MSRVLTRSHLKLLSCMALLVAASGNLAGAASLEEETASRLEQIRAIRAGQDAATTRRYNKELDAAWRFFISRKSEVLPVLRTQLQAEIAREQPSDMVLLDIGFFLQNHDSAAGKATARDALFRLDPSSPIIDANYQQLFQFAHAVARDRDPRVLDLIDRVFLPSDETIFIPQHALQLDGTLVCVFLYGAYGADAEIALKAKLRDPSVSKRVLELLTWLGSPESLTEAAGTMASSPDYETFTRVTSYMMQAGGPGGRQFMLDVAPDRLDAQSRKYYSEIQRDLRQASFAAIRKSVPNGPGAKRLTDAEIKARLNAMIANSGLGADTSARAIVDSKLDTSLLISELLKLRSLTLSRVSDEALSEVQTINAMINALRYKGL